MDDEFEFLPGELVYCRDDLYSDGGVPGYPDGALIAAAGTRGVVVQAGHPEADLAQTIYLVRFEDAARELGVPVGCLPEELTQDAAEAAA